MKKRVSTEDKFKFYTWAKENTERLGGKKPMDIRQLCRRELDLDVTHHYVTEAVRMFGITPWKATPATSNNRNWSAKQALQISIIAQAIVNLHLELGLAPPMGVEKVISQAFEVPT